MPKVWFKYSLQNRLTIWKSARLFHNVPFNTGHLHLVLPALNLATLNAGILIMMLFSLNMWDYLDSSVAKNPWFLVFSFGVLGLGPGLDNQTCIRQGQAQEFGLLNSSMDLE